MINNFSFAIIAGAGGWMAVQGTATVGTIATFINYARQFSRPLNQLAQLYASIQSAIAGAERVLVVACHEDNCRSCHGSTSAHGRSGQVRGDLESLDLGADRVSFHSVAANESHRLVNILADAAGETTEITPEREAAHG